MGHRSDSRWTGATSTAQRKTSCWARAATRYSPYFRDQWNDYYGGTTFALPFTPPPSPPNAAHAAPAAMKDQGTGNRDRDQKQPGTMGARSLVRRFVWVAVILGSLRSLPSRRLAHPPIHRQLLRPRLRLSSRLVARCAASLAPRHLLPALGAQPQLRRRRTALRLLSAAHVDAGRGAWLRPAVEDALPLAITFLFLAGTGLATRALARQALSEGPATLAGCAALFSGYALFTAYERSAFRRAGGRLLDSAAAAAHLARSQSQALRDGRRAFDGSATPLALVVAGAWLSNAPLGVMASYLLAAVALTVALLQRSWAPVLRAAIAAALGLGLAAFYLVPAAWSSAGSIFARPSTIPGYDDRKQLALRPPCRPRSRIARFELCAGLRDRVS